MPQSNVVKYFKLRKGTPAPPQTLIAVERRTAHIEPRTLSLLKTCSDNVSPKMQFTSGYWRRTFSETAKISNGRFLACDKNLGVRFITNNYYNRLAHIEARNYETTITDKVSEQLLAEIQQRLCDIASLISVEANRPTYTYSSHSRWFLNASNATMLRPESDTSTNVAAFLAQLSVYITSTCAGSIERFKLPSLRMTLKVHKPLKNDMIPTRPIIPTCGMPNFPIGQWLGRFMARMARQIPWNLECSEDFITFITDQSRSPRVASFDFSNLYGSEPVRDTLFLFACAVEELEWHFDDPQDELIFTALRSIVDIPESTGLRDLIGARSSIFLLLLADQIQRTIAVLDIDGIDNILCTSKFLAMGCPPVAPLSIITLAYLEIRCLGKERCKLGMKRYIDDIIVDLDIIPEDLLRSAYPSYLTLNCADSHHFLDVSFYHNGARFETWPYVKELAVVPLCYFSAHPTHTIRAAAKNELVRLMKRTTLLEAKPAWAEFWFVKYSHAQYPANMLRNMLKEVIADTRTLRDAVPRGVNHVETWRGVPTETGRDFRVCQTLVSTAWRAAPSLLSIALKAHRTTTPHVSTETVG